MAPHCRIVGLQETMRWGVYLYRAGNSVACKTGIMPPFHHHIRGQRDGITPLFLPAGAGGSALALLHVAVCVAQRARRRPPKAPPASPPTPRVPPPRKSPRAPKPFPGLTHKPHGDACEHATASRPQAPCAPPPPIVSTRGRRRQVDTSRHFCPDPNCRYGGWLGLGNIRANGHPTG